MYVFAFIALALQTAPERQLDLRYLDCVTLVENNAEIGRIAAQQWADAGGGAPAQHCLAIADLANDLPKLAAARLQTTADRADAGDDGERARIYSQAAEAWLIAEQPDEAEKAIDLAFGLAPDAVELLLIAAEIYEAQNRSQKVIDAVSAAETQGYGSVKGFVMRARAYYAFGDLYAAADDVVAALSSDPYNVDALVLRGNIQQAGIVIDVEYGDTLKK